MGARFSRDPPADLLWAALVRQLLHLIRIRHLYLAARRYVEYDNVNNLLLPLRRRSSTPSPVHPSLPSPSAPPLDALQQRQAFQQHCGGSNAPDPCSRSRSERRPLHPRSFHFEEFRMVHDQLGAQRWMRY